MKNRKNNNEPSSKDENNTSDYYQPEFDSSILVYHIDYRYVHFFLDRHSESCGPGEARKATVEKKFTLLQQLFIPFL